MELKVWADGIQRVVCGLTSNTTCHEVVIALAHAMGRTGRFTLVVKWRDNERPLPPSECPLTVLQSWGEYASEVQFQLLMPDKDLIQNKTKHFNSQKRYNFTPPPSKTESVKRSSTFSGVHGVGTQLDRRKELLHVTPDKKLQSINENCSEKAGISTHHPISLSLNLSEDKKTPTPLSTSNNSQCSSSKEHIQKKANHTQLPNIEEILFNQKSAPAENSTILQVKQNLRHVMLPSEKSQNMENNPDNKSSISIPPLVQKKKTPIPCPRKRGDSLERNKASGVDVTLPLYSVAGKPRPEVEEYDLDRNFPDVVKDSNRDNVIEEYHVPNNGTLQKPPSPQDKKEPGPEVLELVRMVTLQQGRKKTQESQIQSINTELSPIEKYEAVSESDLIQCKEQTKNFYLKETANESEIADLELTSWTEIVEREQKLERSLMEEIDLYRSQCDQCDCNMSGIHNRIVKLSNKVDEENAEYGKNKQHQATKKQEATESIASVEKELSDVQAELDASLSLCEETQDAAKMLDDELSQKISEIARMETELVEVNMKDFTCVPLKPGSAKQLENLSGNAKIWDDRLSPRFGKARKIIASPLSKILSITNNPNAVWV